MSNLTEIFKKVKKVQFLFFVCVRVIINGTPVGFSTGEQNDCSCGFYSESIISEMLIFL